MSCQEWNHALAVNDKREKKRLESGATHGGEKKKAHVHKKKKGMPW